MTNITIPPEALRAARAASMNALGDGEDPIRAACLAMLKAWSGMAYRYRIRMSLEPQEIILPLTQEKTNE